VSREITLLTASPMSADTMVSAMAGELLQQRGVDRSGTRSLGGERSVLTWSPSVSGGGKDCRCQRESDMNSRCVVGVEWSIMVRHAHEATTRKQHYLLDELL
jgi:hypothetical protein